MAIQGNTNRVDQAVTIGLAAQVFRDRYERMGDPEHAAIAELLGAVNHTHSHYPQCGCAEYRAAMKLAAIVTP